MEASLKAQTATEYIIILSVVLVLAGIAVTIFYSPASSDGVQWLQQDIGIHNVVFSLHGVEFDVINTMQKTIMIHNISVGDVFLGSFDMVLLPQETRKIQSYDMLTQPGESVDISLSLSYVDQMQYVHTLEYASRTFSGAQKSRIVDRREKMGNQLIAYFPFDDSLEDMTPLRRHGVSSGSISYAHGMIGSAVNVSEGNISVDASVTQKVGFTLAFWMQAFDNGVIFNESVNDAYFSVYREDDLFVEFSDGLNVTSVSFGVDTEWKHVAVVYHPGDGLDLYIDAVLVASNSTLVDPFISEQRIIGSLNVLLDDMYIWQRPIDQNEIKSMYYRALQ